MVLDGESDIAEVEETYDELEPGETEVPNYIDYRDPPYISPQLTPNQQKEINERFNLMRCKGKSFRNQSEFFLLVLEMKSCNNAGKMTFLQRCI